VRLPLPCPILSATLEIRSTDAVLVFVDTDQGVIREGLCFAINGTRLEVLRDMARSFEPLLIGLDPTMAASFYKRAWADIGFFGHARMSVAGLAGVDTALWDLRGRAAGLNVSRSIGARSRPPCQPTRAAAYGSPPPSTSCSGKRPTFSRAASAP
jgi:L-alanine-DL-glutamate epimerase-like enolase superfamily enzyme